MVLTEYRKKEIKEIFEIQAIPILEKYNLNRPDKVITPLEYLEKVKASKEIAAILPPEEFNESEVVHFLNCKTELINSLIRLG